ncbi:hypothetical protein FOA52_011199 [Chlamydomonas sp. UWO 241]|nr:hypothetical protein FOA52_011199 [Chlamydomonas sp. UWO 241]
MHLSLLSFPSPGIVVAELEGSCMLHHRVCVLWPLEEAWYVGTVTDCRREGSVWSYTVAYDDGDTEELELNSEVWTIARDDGAPLLSSRQAFTSAYMEFCDSKGVKYRDYNGHNTHGLQLYTVFALWRAIQDRGGFDQRSYWDKLHLCEECVRDQQGCCKASAISLCTSDGEEPDTTTAAARAMRNGSTPPPQPSSVLPQPQQAQQQQQQQQPQSQPQQQQQGKMPADDAAKPDVSDALGDGSNEQGQRTPRAGTSNPCGAALNPASATGTTTVQPTPSMRPDATGTDARKPKRPAAAATAAAATVSASGADGGGGKSAHFHHAKAARMHEGRAEAHTHCC